MLFERQLGELLFTPIKKLLDRPIKSTLFICVCASYILTLLANSPIPHNALLKNIKEYLAGWRLFITTWGSLIVSGLSLICLALLVIKIVNLFQGKSSELFDFRLHRWLEVYIELSMFYAGILVLVEPSFSSFFTHLDSEYYGAVETFSIIVGLTFTLLSFGYLVVEHLRDEGLF